MGVKGLWQLLLPIGRKVSIETLEGKILAVDLSIWLIQFLSALRDNEGEVIRNAHILGTIKRILKLLHNRIYPVFVFDGETPIMKLKTLKLRSNSRHQKEIKLREQSLLNHYKLSNIVLKNENLESTDQRLDESSNDISKLPDVQYLKKSSPSRVMSDSDNDIIWEEKDEYHLLAKDISNNHGSDDDEYDWDIPEELNADALASLPFQIKKGVIEEVRRKERLKKRATYMPVLANPVLYSQTQLVNFLRSSKLNSTIFEAQKILDNNLNCKRIASDGNKLFSLQNICTDIADSNSQSINCDDVTYTEVLHSVKYDINPNNSVVNDNKLLKIDHTITGNNSLLVNFSEDSRFNTLINENNFSDILWESDEDITDTADISPNIVSANVLNNALSTANNLGNWAERIVNKELRKYGSVESNFDGIALESKETNLINKDSPSITSKSDRLDYISKNCEELKSAELDSSQSLQYYSNLHSKSSTLNNNEFSYDEMKMDIIKLLQVFELPYIIAPFEAEAQCAALEKLGLVDGIVSEDSDAFLFGGRTIYKNIFKDKKFVEVYSSDDAEKDLGISRDDFISLGILLGSDYTDGVKGVGIVNAMEIMDAFNIKSLGPLDGLTNFKNWLNNHNYLETTLKLKKKKRSLHDEIEDSDSSEDSKNESSQHTNAVQSIKEFERKHKYGKSSWKLSSNFPDKAVIDAYKNPKACYAKTKFQWVIPKLHRVRSYCRDVLQWSEAEIDLNIDPVIQKLSSSSYQPTIDSYFMSLSDNNRFGELKSKRLEHAVTQLTGKSISKSVRNPKQSKNNFKVKR